MALHKASKEVFERFRAELNEFDDEKIHENIKKISDWLATKPHLPRNYDKRMLHQYIRACKHDLERVKRKINMYYILRGDVPDIYANRDPFAPNIQNVMNNFSIMIPLPDLTPDGCRITMFDLNKDINLFDLPSIYKTVFMITDIRLVEEGPIRGDIVVFNTENVLAKHVPKLFIPLSKKVFLAAEEAYPQRLRQIHVIGSAVYVEKGINFFKMFVKSTIRSRFHVHSNMESLHKFIPTKCLPKEYGGELDSIKKYTADWKEKLESYSEYFKQQESICADKDKISPNENYSQPINRDEYGINGSFRKLAID